MFLVTDTGERILVLLLLITSDGDIEMEETGSDAGDLICY